MKKVLSIVLVMIFLVPAFATADSNLADLSYDELISLHRQIITEIMSRPEWKEVTVPAGTWLIGRDIPAGAYSLRPTSGYSNVTVWKNEPGDYSDRGMVYNELIGEDSPYGRMELKEGWTIEFGNSIIFAPPVQLGF